MAAKNQLTQLERRLEKKVDGLQNQFVEFRKEVKEGFEPKLEKVHEFMVEQIGYAKGIQSVQKDDGSIKISKEVWGILVKLIGYVGVGFAIIQAILGLTK